jgi:type IV pilus assembly protein PilE
MRKFQNFRTRVADGFTLVELMVVVLIITILTVIAVPSYRTYVLKSHRAEAKSILMDLASRQERYMTTNGVYSTLATDMGYTGTWPQTVGSGYYIVSLSNVAAPIAGSSSAAPTPATFLFTATATGAQLNDTLCKTFTVNQQGLQTSTNSSNGTSSGCW